MTCVGADVLRRIPNIVGCKGIQEGYNMVENNEALQMQCLSTTQISTWSTLFLVVGGEDLYTLNTVHYITWGCTMRGINKLTGNEVSTVNITRI